MREIFTPPSSAAGEYSAIVFPTYQRAAKQAPVSASKAGNKRSQRNAGGWKVTVTTDCCLDCGTFGKEGEINDLRW
jgi:hypothetical protein